MDNRYYSTVWLSKGKRMTMINSRLQPWIEMVHPRIQTDKKSAQLHGSVS
jgi:hypothetical protein